MNRLINETSPYLLQHAHNPVDWFPWGEEALQKAKAENKPIIVSIGYSACHWCHVMERESFENEALAELMNKYYVSIKIDREERPDVDAVYMDALHAMGLRGGWPLNVFLMPDGKPFYGGTYFPPVQRGQHPGWREVLIGVANAFADPENRQKLHDSAEGFTQNMLFTESEKYGLSADNELLNTQDLAQVYERIAQRFDNVWGGSGAAPKFPMPCRYEFLLRYFSISKNKETLEHLELTLDCMALGGIYDQLGGGFARYSTDDEWLAPHFEKMLYDNAQLLSAYAQAYALTQKGLYKGIITQTVHWLEREMTSPEGGFYSALDADSEGVEGKFYTWSKTEIEEVLGRDAEDFCRIYQVSQHGNWEETNILWRNRQYQLTDDEQHKLPHWQAALMAVRDSRIRPGLDDKILASWNGLTIKGLIEAYRVISDEKILALALQNGQFLFEKMCYQPAEPLHLCLWHSYKNSEAKIMGYLEDYAAVIEGFTILYQVTFEEKWLHRAEKLALYAHENFWDENDQFFFFTDKNSEILITRKKEIFDNVIPSSNAMMARNYYTLGLLLDREDFMGIAQLMLSKVKKLLLTDADYLCNWAALAADMASTTAEVCFVGADAQRLRQEFDLYFVPNKVVLGTEKGSELPLLANRKPQEKSLIYVCYNKTCQMPVETAKEALSLIS